MDRFTCTCNGENPNCFKCDGTGMVPRASPTTEKGAYQRERWSSKSYSSQTHPTPHPETRLGSASPVKPVTKTKSDQILCPVCRIEFHFREFPHHRRREHPFSKETRHFASGRGMPQTSAGSSAPKTLRECPDCKAQVINLQKHTNKVHSLESQVRRQKKENLKSQRLVVHELRLEQQRTDEETLAKYRLAYPDAKVCGFCRAMLQDLHSLHAHFRAAHGLKPKTQPRKRVHSSTSVPLCDTRHADASNAADTQHSSESRTKSGPSDPYALENSERRMDATYGMGGTARDRGRFGSSTSYDSMDDESSP